MDVHPELTGVFEQLMRDCVYSSFVHKAFEEIRRSRVRKELLPTGECVRRIMPAETIQYIDRMSDLCKRIDEISTSLPNRNGTYPHLN
jgi:hypothetical protein